MREISCVIGYDSWSVLNLAIFYLLSAAPQLSVLCPVLCPVSVPSCVLSVLCSVRFLLCQNLSFYLCLLSVSSCCGPPDAE
jgi:hypothetical protein